VLLAVLFGLGAPLWIWAVKDRPAFLRNIGRVLSGASTWVGFHPGRHRTFKLPRLRQGVIDAVTAQGLRPDPLTVDRVNITYAKDYHPWQDIRWTLGNLARLGD